MKLTTKSEYAIVSLLYLARHEKELIKIEDLCNSLSLPKKYLEQIFTILKKNKLIATKTGATGGYQLAKPAQKINLAQIIRLLDGALAPTLSVSHYFYQTTPISQEKKALKLFKIIRDFISQKLEHTTLADLI